jgi:hypothetical protein
MDVNQHYRNFDICITEFCERLLWQEMVEVSAHGGKDFIDTAQAQWRVGWIDEFLCALLEHIPECSLIVPIPGEPTCTAKLDDA